MKCGLWQGFTDASLRCSGDRWEDDTPVCSSPQSDLIILCRNTDPKLCEVIFSADIQKLFYFLRYSPFRDKSVQVHSYNLNLSLPICHSPKIYYLSNIYQIPITFILLILVNDTKESIYLSQEVVNTKSRLWPSVFSVRLFQTQYQLAAGDVSINLSHFHWRSRTLGI